MGVSCGCGCQCNVALTDGNVMEYDCSAEIPDWQPDEAHVLLLICVDCYVGGHL